MFFNAPFMISGSSTSAISPALLNRGTVPDEKSSFNEKHGDNFFCFSFQDLYSLPVVVEAPDLGIELTFEPR